MTTESPLAGEVRRIGLAAGLDALAICDAHPFDETRQILHERASVGWSAGMQFTYRNPERSTTPAATLPGAAAIVVGARRYERRTSRTVSPGGREAVPTAGAVIPPPDLPSDFRMPPAGRVAMYAWVDHYRSLRAALGCVAEHLTLEGWRARVVADDNALVDRAAAVRAGLGWYGKNANVLLPGAGSWFVLGSVITDAPLTASASPPVPGARRLWALSTVPGRLPDRSPGRSRATRRSTMPGLVAASTRHISTRVSGGPW